MHDRCRASVPADKSTDFYEGYWLNFSNIYPWNFWHQSRYKFHHPQLAPSAALRGLMLFPFQRFCLFVYKTILWHTPSGVYWAPGTISFVSLFKGGGGLSIHGHRNQWSRALGGVYKCLRVPPIASADGQAGREAGVLLAGRARPEPGHPTWLGWKPQAVPPMCRGSGDRSRGIAQQRDRECRAVRPMPAFTQQTTGRHRQRVLTQQAGEQRSSTSQCATK